ncbi:hypothetical protein Q5762_13795 [Streptomyces sp. P9(2023)]|uniref:hypothetical protein n=1 Tax=Streptomyces sp. P9(2023) TaxID=3064394 RepID=UPI0028F403F7|nr:hypothetical protein [Streptomyces sp. P9(2023)]MDT9689389.1 hypothetical protein [Streptomyces sp. P9(2023)]
MATSRVPAAVDALLAILRAAPALDDVLILDGPPTNGLTGNQRLYVGWTPDGGPAVALSQDFNAAGARTRDETFAINCYAEVSSGDIDMHVQRTRVFELVGAVETALRATNEATMAPTLSNTVLWSHLTAGDLSQEQGEGARAGLVFMVSCMARI